MIDAYASVFVVENIGNLVLWGISNIALTFTWLVLCTGAPRKYYYFAVAECELCCLCHDVEYFKVILHFDILSFEMVD